MTTGMVRAAVSVLAMSVVGTTFGAEPDPGSKRGGVPRGSVFGTREAIHPGSRVEDNPWHPNSVVFGAEARFGAEPKRSAPRVGGARPGREQESVEALGRRLFVREWTPDDPRSLANGGDGLGPVFNDRSCVACHRLGGPGGGGSRENNVNVVSIATDQGQPLPAAERAGAARLHPGFETSDGVVLHKAGLSPAYEPWVRRLFGLEPTSNAADPNPNPIEPLKLPRSVVQGKLRVTRTERNSTALFGAGLIDAIPDAVLEAESLAQARLKPATRGLVSRTEDGRIGRFGWRAHVPHLRDFVLTACAVELGLEVPGRHQAVDPLGFGDRELGLDLSATDASALIAFVRGLPRPIERQPEGHAEGRAIFTKIGCADCHRPNLGGVEGLYSDLLLHDMGEPPSGSGSFSYSAVTRGRPDIAAAPAPVPARADSKEPVDEAIRRRGLRTPPLWGVADSAPYLHDGSARDLEEAITLGHSNQGFSAMREFHRLPDRERLQLLGFLKSLKGPSSAKREPTRLTRAELQAERRDARAVSQAR